MALNICSEALIRLFFEIVNFAFGDVTAIAREGMDALWETILPTMLQTIILIAAFYFIKALVRNRTVSNIIIVSIPIALQTAGSFLGGIPVIGWIFAGTLFVTAAITSAIAWGFLTITDETVPFLLRIVGLPGMMIIGAVAGILGPFGIAINLGGAIAVAMTARITIPLSTLVIIAITIWSPTWFCETINNGLKMIANIRQSGLIEGISESLITIPLLIKKRIIKLNKRQ